MDIRKRSLSKQGAPGNGVWAVAGYCDGHYGVTLGARDEIVGFIPEDFLTESNLEKIRSEDGAVHAELIRRAAADLSRLKAEVDYRETRHQNG